MSRAIRTLPSDQVADAANIAWIGLSNACHHHAYKLTPTAEEVRHWLDLVASLNAPASLTSAANQVQST